MTTPFVIDNQKYKMTDVLNSFLALFGISISTFDIQASALIGYAPNKVQMVAEQIRGAYIFYLQNSLPKPFERMSDDLPSTILAHIRSVHKMKTRDKPSDRNSSREPNDCKT